MSRSALRQAPVPEAPTADEPARRGTVLVCATPPATGRPLVMLAGGSYETETERVFFDAEPGEEVLRLPLTAPVAVRPVRRASAIPAQPTGEQALARAVRRARGIAPDRPHQESGQLTQGLLGALRAGDAGSATHLAALLAQRRGTAAVYEAMGSCLADLGTAWADGHGTVLAERTATHAAQAVGGRLLEHAPAPTRCGTVVLATPPGERHTLALTALAHVLQNAGRPVLVVDELPVAELAQLAAQPGTVAVVLSAHLTLPAPAARRLLSTLRKAAPDVLLAAGGPGFPHSTPVGADLVTDDLEVLVRELDERTSALTVREHEVLLGVADGLTNAEIAEQLYVSPSTVKTHLDHVFAKTHTEHRAAAVARALRQGWIR
jgi:DNA-binding CsgD family transcriptional regulator